MLRKYISASLCTFAYLKKIIRLIRLFKVFCFKPCIGHVTCKRKREVLLHRCKQDSCLFKSSRRNKKSIGLCLRKWIGLTVTNRHVTRNRVVFLWHHHWETSSGNMSNGHSTSWLARNKNNLFRKFRQKFTDTLASANKWPCGLNWPIHWETYDFTTNSYLHNNITYLASTYFTLALRSTYWTRKHSKFMS